VELDQISAFKDTWMTALNRISGQTNAPILFIGGQTLGGLGAINE
jgi:hypothetical protein